MEIEEEKKQNENEENDDDLLQKFSKHKTINNKYNINNTNNININKNNKNNSNIFQNKNNIFIKCSFDKKAVEDNIKLLDEYEKNGIIKTNHYYALDKDELEDPIDPKKIRIDKNIKGNYYIFENDIENSDLYCGYIDHLNLQKVKNQNKSIISCPYCFNLISNNILENKTEQGYIIIGKSKSIFKDFSSNIMNYEDAKKLFKDNKGIKNYEKEYNEKENKIKLNLEKNKFKIDDNDNDYDNNEDIEMENNEDKKKYVIISCINCGNIIGLYNTLDNTKIIFDYL